MSIIGVRVAEGASARLPEPWSDDPTQWLFEGRPEVSTAPLQVAVARLLGYRWPEQAESDDLDAFADADGIVCLPSVAGEPPAADRVQQLLAAAFGECVVAGEGEGAAGAGRAARRRTSPTGCGTSSSSSTARCSGTGRSCGTSGTAQRDGFSALVNYHRLDRKTLEKLTYTYLGQDWVERQRAEVRDEVAGAEARLAAALESAAQARGDPGGRGALRHLRAVEGAARAADRLGARSERRRALNIRPFVEAGVLRSPFNIHWKKDRGKNPDGTERHNDIHLTLAEKLDARKRVGCGVSETVLDRWSRCLRRSARRTTPNARCAPVALLWPDEGGSGSRSSAGSRSACRSWRSASYDPEARRGPAYWLRCVVARTIDAGLPDGRRSSTCRASPQ